METIGVIGAGQMGAGIAQTVARHGMKVLLSDVDLAAAERGKAGIDKALTRLVGRGKLETADAEATLARDQTLVRSQAVSEIQLRAAQLARDQAELALRDAELALERRVIRAPFDGWVGILGVDIGDQVTSATEVATLDDRSHILVDFRVPERFVGQVKVGAPH